MKRLLFSFLFAFVATLATLHAAPGTSRTRPAPPKPAPDGQRFLFVVDIGSTMRANEAGNRQALFDLIFTGFDGQMRTGDSFGVWLFNEALHAQQFPMQVWEESKPIETASNAAKFLREQKYSGKSRLDVVMPRLLNLIKTVRDVTIVILSDGESPPEGTPFDTKIAAVYERRKSERNKEQKPFATILVARGGMIVTGAVVIAGEYVELPARPAPRVAGTETNNIASTTNKVRPIAAAPNPVAHPVQPAMTTTTTTTTSPAPSANANATDEPQVSVTLSPPPAVGAPAPPVPKVIRIVTRSNALPQNPVAATVPILPTNTPHPAITTTAAPSVAASTPTPPSLPQPASPAKTEPAVDLSVPPPTAPNPGSAMPVAAREPASTIPADARPISSETPSVNVATMPASGLTGTVLLTIGGLLLAGCLVLIALVLRRPKFAQQSSIITRSMDQRR